MPAEALSLPGAAGDAPSVPPGSTFARVLRILEDVDLLDASEAGELRFGPHGSILVESRRVCWARAAGLTRRLTDTLRKQRNPPLESREISEVIAACRTQGLRIGEALVKSGLVTEAGLRVALDGNVVDAIEALARVDARLTDFVPHAKGLHDPRFVFSTGEIAASVFGRDDPALKVVLRRHLLRSLGAELTGFAALGDGATPRLLAFTGSDPPPLRALLSAAARGLELRSRLEEDGAPLHVDASRDHERLVVWRKREAVCVAIPSPGSDEREIHERLAEARDDERGER